MMKKILLFLLIVSFMVIGPFSDLQAQTGEPEFTNWLGETAQQSSIINANDIQDRSAPLASFGPILFAEPEFPSGGLLDGFSTNTINGVPLLGPLSFSPSIPNDARFNPGPPAQDYLDGFGIEGSDQQTLTINFGVDVSDIQFSFALCEGVLTTVPNGVMVQAFDSQISTRAGSPLSNQIGSDDIDPADLFGEQMPDLLIKLIYKECMDYALLVFFCLSRQIEGLMDK